MSSIDERVVEMKFNNSQFQRGTKETLSTLDKLKQGLNLSTSTKNLEGLSDAGKRFSLSHVAAGIDGIAGKFSALGIAGVTALATIANQAVNTGMHLVNSLTMEPILDGFREYELKMGSIQTILANTSRHGTTLSEVTANLDDLNAYADKTIYNFGDMTKNIGLFTNAGIKIEDATSMIKGFSNEAAASGTSAAGAAGAAYQLSQALSAGTIRLMDWRSLQNVGMGNKNMQNGLIEIADAMGTLEANSISATEVQSNFNGSLEKNWLSADVMSTYLKIMAGDMTAAEQASLGLTDAQVEMFSKQQTMGEEAATKVRTWTQLLSTMQESVGSSWAETFNLLVGDFDQATVLFTNVNDTLGSMITAAGNARNDLLKGWADLGGRDVAIEAISNAFDALMSVIKPIQEAFSEIFPPATAENLFNITTAIRDFTETLKIGGADAENLKSTFRGVFAVLDIGWEIIKGLVGVFTGLFGQVAGGTGSFLEFTGSIGDWLVKVRDAIKSGEGLSSFFEGLGRVLKVPLDLISGLGAATKDFLNVNSWAEAWNNVSAALAAVVEFLRPIGQWFSDAFSQIKTVVTEAFRTMDLNVLVGLMNVGAIAGVGVIIKGLVGKLRDAFGGMGGGVIDSIKGAFKQLTSTMETMQQKLQADILMRIAIAIGILTAAVVALSFIDTGKLFITLGAIGTMMAELMGAMVVMEKAVSSKGVAKMPFIAAALIGLAAAMLTFSLAVAIMSALSWEDLAQGLGGMAAGLIMMSTAAAAMGKVSGRLIFAAPAMLLMATALLILSGALKVMGTMSWEEIGRGLTVLAGSLLILIVAMKAMTGSVLSAAAMLVIAFAMTVLTGALKLMATMSWEDIGKSMVVLAGSLLILAAAMYVMGNPMVLLGAIGILAASAAMMMLAPAMALLGSMSWDAIGRGLTVLAGALGLLAIGGVLLLPAIPAFIALGSAILMVGLGAVLAGIGLASVASGLLLLAGAIALIPVEGFLTFVGTIALAALILAPVLPILLLLSAALVGIGIAVALAGAGMVMFSLGLSMFGPAANTAAHGLDTLAASVANAAKDLPAMLGMAAGLLLFGVGALVAGLGAIVLGAGLLVLGLALALISVFGESGASALDRILQSLMGLIPQIPGMMALGGGFAALGAGALVAGAGLLMIGMGGFLAVAALTMLAVAATIGAMGLAIISRAITSMSAVLPSMIELGTSVGGLSAQILALGTSSGVAAAGMMMIALATMMLFSASTSSAAGLTMMVAVMTNGFPAAAVAAQGAVGIMSASLNQAGSSIDVFKNRILQSVPAIVAASILLGDGFRNGIQRATPGIIAAGNAMISGFEGSIRGGISRMSGSVGGMGYSVGYAISQGMAQGLFNGSYLVTSAARSVAANALAASKAELGVHSPSREYEWIGEMSDKGLAGGLKKHAGLVAQEASGVGTVAVDSLRDSLTNVSDILGSDVDMNPTITPVLDLTNVKKNAGTLNGLLGPSSITTASGYDRASDISVNPNASQEEMLRIIEAKSGPNITNVNFEQNNTSPKALSTVELYRKTKNQINAAKEALNK